MLTRLRSRTVAFALVLVAVVTVNVAQFRTIDENTNARYRALNRSDTADVLVIGYQQSPDFRERYGLHLALAELAPGSRVVVPAGSAYASHEWSMRLQSLGLAGYVDRVTVDSELEQLHSVGDPHFDPGPSIVARGPGGQRGAPWAIALDQDTPPDDAEAAERFLRQALRDGSRGSSAGPPREFLLVRWHSPVPDTGHDHHDLLLETSLLPAAGRAELAP